MRGVSTSLGRIGIAKSVDKIAEEIRELPDVEKLRLVDGILSDLDKPDPEIDRVWADEARKRRAAYKAGKVPTVSYESVMAKHRRSRKYVFSPQHKANSMTQSHGTTDKRRG
jgi:putative addiction module component (TIGR02574 family)